MRKKKSVRPDPKVRSFFILAFPTLIIVALAMLFETDVKVSVIMIVITIYQFLMLKQFVDQYHEVL